GIVDHDTKTLCDAGAAAHNDGLPGHFIFSPASNSFVNTSVVSYTLSEDVFSGSITWTGTSGDDNGSIHEIELTSACDEGIVGHDTKTLCDDGDADHSDGLSGHFTTELLAFDNKDLALTNDMDDLVDGSYYDISWSALDSADNPSPENISTRVLYDVTPPIVYIDYKYDVVKSGYEDTICWVHFNERVRPDPGQKPTISIKFLDDPTTPAVNEGTELLDIVDQPMTIFSIDGVDDSTKWFYEGIIPSPGGTEAVDYCSTNVTINVKDLAGNDLPVTGCDETIDGHSTESECDDGAAAHSDGLSGHFISDDGTKYFSNTFSVTGSNNQDTLNYSILVIDNSAPVCSLSYVNINKPLLTDEVDDYSDDRANGKGGDIIRITASLNKEFGKLPELPNPRLRIDFSYPNEIIDTLNIDSSLSVLLQDSLGVIDSTAQRTPYFINGDSTVVWYLKLPDAAHGLMTVTIHGTDRAVNPIGSYAGPLESDIENKTRFRIDNIVPDTLVTGLV
ncbi:uncharacterized protein METZ01_LOCUS222903, partial [marine metagenome]